jgi:hypothetical protein
MQPLNKAILSRIYGHGRGWVFTPKHFADLADPNLISAMLSKLAKKGTIRRVVHGIYDYPKTHPKLGLLFPTVESVIEALKVREGTSFQAAGAYAANILGLSEQVPSKVVFYTNGKSRKIQIAKLTIELKKKSQRNILLAGTISGLIVEALRYMGKNGVREAHIKRLAHNLPATEKKRIKAHLRYVPIWMHPHLLRIIGENNL